MADTHKLWELIKDGIYDVALSSVDFLELSRCSEVKQALLAGFLAQIKYQYIDVSGDILSTADRFVDLKILPMKSYLDCQHIAAALHSGCDIVVSWNFKHMVTIDTIRGAKVVTALENFKDIMICSPNMLIQRGFNNDNDAIS